MESKVWTKDEIKNLLETNDQMVARSVKKLYEYQTADEQEEKTANINNGVGFNGTDAEFLSSIAEWLISGKKLSQKQLDITRKKLFKYAGQLAKIANIEGSRLDG